MADLTEIRARAAAHQRQLDAQTRFFKPAQLAARWGCAVSSVLGIPFDALPYTVIGEGARRLHRRYDPADVAQYEHARPRRSA